MFMRKFLLVSLLLALAVPSFAQFGSNTARRINSGTAAPPATCSSSPVDAYVRTGATLPGLYLCQSANTWSGPLSTSGGTFTGDVYFKSGRPWIDVRAYGAVGDGVVDDTSPVQSAITAAASVNGVVFIPIGTYLQTGLTVSGNVSLVGSSQNGSILKLKNSSNSTCVNVTGISVSFSNFTIDCNDTNQ